MPRLIPLPPAALESRGWSAADRVTVQVVLDGYQALIEGADPAQVSTVYRDDYRDHASTVPGGDLTSLVAMVQQSTENAPGTEIELLQLTVDADLVVVHSKGRRNPEDGWDAIMEIFRVEDSRIAEHWEVIEPAGFFHQPKDGGEDR